MSNKYEQNQFSKYAKEYGKNNIIQQIVSKALIRDITSKPKRILELGCGSGQVYNQIQWDFEYYKAIDSSPQMCDLHPKSKNIDIVCSSFDSEEFYQNISNNKFDMIISSSALQWSKDLDKLLHHLQKISNEVHCVLFTSNTFKTIQSITKTVSPILDIQTIKNAFLKKYHCKFEVLNYNLEFSSKKEMFRYIKNSGVNGKSNLSYKEAKYLYKEYNLNYLEFEVIFIKAFSSSSL
jgi:malonyl-CoA O-methyltransferase